MPRPERIALGGYVYHVLNRANGRLRIFRKPADFLAFEKILGDGLLRFSMRLCGYCLLSNHWHLLVWPRGDDDLPTFMRWVTLTHVQRYHASHATIGIGHLYQGRYKSFPVQGDGHYLRVLRYIEANPLHAGLVESPDQWAWSSLAVRTGRPSIHHPPPRKTPKKYLTAFNSTWRCPSAIPHQLKTTRRCEVSITASRPISNRRSTHCSRGTS